MSHFPLGAADDDDAGVPRLCCLGRRSVLLFLPRVLPLTALAALLAFALIRANSRRIALSQIFFSALVNAASDASSSESKAVVSVMVDKASAATKRLMEHMCFKYPSPFFARAASPRMSSFRDFVAFDSVLVSVFQTCGCHVSASQSACECAMPPLK